MEWFGKFFDFVKTDVLVILMSFVIYCLGTIVSYKKKATTLSYQSYRFFLGIFVICLWGWISYKLGIFLPLSINIGLIFSSAVFIGLFSTCLFIPKQCFSFIHRDEFKDLFLDITIISSICCLVFLLITSSSSHSVITVHGNIDLFNWSLVADFIRTHKGFASIIPNGIHFIHDNIENSFGTYYLLAYFSKFLGLSSLESTTYIFILISVVNVFLIQEIIAKYFSIHHRKALFLSVFSLFNPFYIYLMFNHFFAYLFSLMALFSFILNLREFESPSVMNKLYYLLIPVFSLLLIYTYGVIAYDVIFLEVGFIYGFIKFNSSKQWLGYFKSGLKNFFITLLLIIISFSLVPQISFPLFKNLGSISSNGVGWGLPRLPIYQLLLPGFFKFPHLIKSFSKEIFLDFMMIGFGIVSIFVIKNYEYTKNLIKFLVILFLNICIYYMFFYLKGPSYQSWKLASYLILPFSFVYLVLLYQGLKSIIQGLKISSEQSEWILVFSLGLYFLLKALAHFGLTFHNFDSRITELKKVQKATEVMPQENKLVLGLTGDDLEAAFCILNEKFQLIPKVMSQISPPDKSYIPSLDENKTSIITPHLSQGLGHLGYEIFSLKTLKQLELEKVTLRLQFSQLNVFNPLNISFKQGFSGIEDWGIWTDSNIAQMQLIIPNHLLNHKLFFNLKIQPYIVENSIQDFDVMINGKNMGEFELKENSEIEFLLPQGEGHIGILFNIKHPLSPPVLSPDSRKIGLGFVEYQLVSRGKYS
jgi:hypothetical protein